MNVKVQEILYFYVHIRKKKHTQMQLPLKNRKFVVIADNY